MTTYYWIIELLDVCPTENGLTNVVDRAHWQYWADDGAGHTAMVYGVQEFAPPDPNNFTPYDQLTEAQCAGWRESMMGEEEMLRMRASLDANIAEQVSPPFVHMPPPWA